MKLFIDVWVLTLRLVHPTQLEAYLYLGVWCPEHRRSVKYSVSRIRNPAPSIRLTNEVLERRMIVEERA